MVRQTLVPPNVTRSTKLWGAQLALRSTEFLSPENSIFPALQMIIKDVVYCLIEFRVLYIFIQTLTMVHKSSDTKLWNLFLLKFSSKIEFIDLGWFCTFLMSWFFSGDKVEDWMICSKLCFTFDLFLCFPISNIEICQLSVLLIIVSKSNCSTMLDDSRKDTDALSNSGWSISGTTYSTCSENSEGFIGDSVGKIKIVNESMNYSLLVSIQPNPLFK